MQQLTDLIKADIAATAIAFLGLVIAFLGLAISFWQARRQQRREHLEEIRLREIEIKEAVKQRQHIEQQLKLQAQQVKFQGEQITQILDWVSKITFSSKTTD
jgi:Flp pilus assembly protein TadB